MEEEKKVPETVEVRANLTYHSNALELVLRINIGEQSKDGSIDCAFEITEATLGAQKPMDKDSIALLEEDQQLVDTVSKIVDRVVSEVLDQAGMSPAIH